VYGFSGPICVPLSLTVYIAYGLFGIDRLITSLELASDLDILGIVLRIVAYLLVLFALYKALVKK
jgi:hypothetical protein